MLRCMTHSIGANAPSSHFACDISYGNIIVVEELKPRGVLIDWHVADRMLAHPFEERITKTRLFTAHRFFFPGHLHSLQDDLESLLYVSLHVSTNRQLPGAHSLDKNIDATKHWHLTLEAPFEELLGKCADSSRPLLAQLRGIIASALSTALLGSAASLLSSSSAASATTFAPVQHSAQRMQQYFTADKLPMHRHSTLYRPHAYAFCVVLRIASLCLSLQSNVHDVRDSRW